jgi:rubrerythrin
MIPSAQGWEMMGSNSLGSIDAVLDFAVRREQESRKLYLDYAAQTDHTGLRSLLLAMADQEKGHEQILTELGAKRSVDPLFTKPLALDLKISDYTLEVSFDPAMGYQDFLLLVIQKEEKSFLLYRKLESLSSGEELKYVFRGLAEEEKRHKSLAQDRYDLEILTEN